MRMDLRFLEKRTLQRLQQSPGLGGSYILAVSGGVDSVVMLEVLSRIQKALGWNLSVAHVHHGESSDQAQNHFRQQTQDLVKNLAYQKNFVFLTNEAGTEIKDNEESMRNFRYTLLERWQDEQNAAAVLLAHQNQDWLESQLIQMIRGGVSTDPNNSRSSSVKLRPLGDWTKNEILFYANENQLTWFEDPTNEQGHTLRNWLRNQWLPQLEAYRSGSLETLARSLNLLWSQNNNSQDLLKKERLWLSPTEVSRPDFLVLSEADQRRVIAAMMNNSRLRNYSHSHVKEVMKRLDTEQNNFMFSTAKATWSVGPVAFKIHSDTRPDGSSVE